MTQVTKETKTTGPKQTKLTWLPKKTFELELTVPWSQVEEMYKKVLKEETAEATLKGFRKGKAPEKMVEQTIGKQKLYEKVLQRVLIRAYEEAIKQQHLAPLVSPKIDILGMKENEDWKFKATSCERPDVKLNKYQDLIKGEVAKKNIWLPGKDKDEKKPRELTREEKINLATKTLLSNLKIEVADLLIEDELNHMLTRFLDQIQSLGMTVNQYLNSKGITNEQLRESYRKQAEDNLRFEFILQAIVAERKIDVSKAEVDKMIQISKDEKVRKQLDTPIQRTYIASIIAKRKAIDYLSNL